jgi:hypothetical protein
MCGMPDCDVAPTVRTVKTRVPGTVAVDINVCPRCDVGQCKTCNEYVQSRTAALCSNGHRL